MEKEGSGIVLGFTHVIDKSFGQVCIIKISLLLKSHELRSENWMQEKNKTKKLLGALRTNKKGFRSV